MPLKDKSKSIATKRNRTLKKYNCIFPGLYNYILAKDVGMIPYTLSDRLETTVTTYENDDYTYLDDFMKKDNFRIDILEKTGNERKDVINYIRQNASNIDIIQFYHLRYNILPYYVLVYKLHNPRGHIYLKLDSHHEYIDFLVKRSGIGATARRLLVKILFKFINTVSTETKRNYDTLRESSIIDNKKLLYIPNGVNDDDTSLEDKHKTILYVGFIQKLYKRCDILFDALSKVDLKGWKVVLIGEIGEDMEGYLEEYYRQYPELEEKIIYKGYIKDKKLLATEYAKSSIYCCTSDRESFGLSLLEASYHGNYLISTDVGACRDILDKTGYGHICSHTTESVRDGIQYTIDNWDKIIKDPYTIRRKVYDDFNWNKICDRLYTHINGG